MYTIPTACKQNYFKIICNIQPRVHYRHHPTDTIPYQTTSDKHSNNVQTQSLYSDSLHPYSQDFIIGTPTHFSSHYVNRFDLKEVIVLSGMRTWESLYVALGPLAKCSTIVWTYSRIQIYQQKFYIWECYPAVEQVTRDMFPDLRSIILFF